MLFDSSESYSSGKSYGVFDFLLKLAEKAETTFALEIYASSGFVILERENQDFGILLCTVKAPILKL